MKPKTAWLTYNARIKMDIERLYEINSGSELFGIDYLKTTSEHVKNLESNQVKLIITQMAIVGFLILGIVSGDPSVSLFGLSFKKSNGVRDILLISMQTITFLTIIIGTAKDSRIQVMNNIIEKKHSDESGYIRMSIANPFNINIAYPSLYNDWIFEKASTKTLQYLLLFLATTIVSMFICLVLFVQIVLYVDLYNNPSEYRFLSGFALVFSAAVWVFSVLWLAYYHLPLPYTDGSHLKMRQTKAAPP